MKQKISAVAAVIFIITAATVLTFLSLKTDRLTIRDADSGKLYASFEANPGDRFSVEFIHSVNKSPVRDIYEIAKDGRLYVMETEYYGFGAGVQTELAEGETLTYRNGAMIVGNINKEIPRLSYFVGTVSDHVFRMGEIELSLRDACGRNANIVFAYEKWLFSFN